MNVLFNNSLKTGIQIWGDLPHIHAAFYNRNIILDEIKIKNPAIKSWISLKQTHSAKVYFFKELSTGRFLEGDALICDQAMAGLVIHTADCLPLLVTDGTRIGACHAGWRGVAQGIVRNWLGHFQKSPLLRLAIGPGIGPCHFEVHLDVAEKLAQSEGFIPLPADLRPQIFLKHKDKSKTYVDLQRLVLWQLQECGISKDQITIIDNCTHCDEKLFYSYRRDGAKPGRMEAIICRSE